MRTFGSAASETTHLASDEASDGGVLMTIDETFDTEIADEASIDPVCENTVDPNEAVEHELSTIFADREYLFCSVSCKRQFEQRPTAYAVAGRSEP